MRSGRVVITSLFLDCATRMEDRWECMFVEEFVAEPTVEALDTCIIPAFRLAAHARSHAKYFHDISKIFTRIRASAIRIKDCSNR